MSEAMVDKSNWLNLEVNGQPVQMPPGSTIMDAAVKLQLVIPHFCYHKKLSLAASCRMCLVQVEKVPKPVPACATVVNEGMRVWTRSEVAHAAQKAVMSFLMINHPLDCPVCDQGGECQLQDIAFGYGQGTSSFAEVKRAVPGKNLGPLVSAAEMSRCIQCTRCVRFADEIGGKMELGMVQRGDRSEIVPFVGETYDSEISGNVIDLCPVGALTSKPARYTVRAWELVSHPTLSPHDAHGTPIIAQVKGNTIKRVVAASHEAINECWIADRDRFSCEALVSPQRLLRPRIKQEDGTYTEVEWEEALAMAATRLRTLISKEGADAIGGLISPSATLEELAVFTQMLRGLGCDNIDSRLRQRDFSDEGMRAGVPWLGMPIAEVSRQKTLLFIGSFLRHDHPLLAIRVRQAAKAGAKVYSVHAQCADWRLPLADEIVVRPSQLVNALGELVVAAHRYEGNVNVGLPEILEGIEPSASAVAMVEELRAQRGQAAVFLGSFAQHSDDAATLMALAHLLTTFTGATLGVLPDSGNRVGASWLNVQPEKGGRNARTVFEQPRRAYLLFNVEGDDLAVGRAFGKALSQADFILSFAQFLPDPNDVPPDIILPVTPFAEMSGTLINMEGRVQLFRAAVPAAGEARPGWKVLTALALMLGQSGHHDSLKALRRSCIPEAEALRARLSNKTRFAPQPAASPGGREALMVERMGGVPIYQADAILRHAPSLQKTVLARPPAVVMNPRTAQHLFLSADAVVRVRDNNDRNALTAPMSVVVDETLPEGTVRVDAAHEMTRMLAGCSGLVKVEVCND